MRNVVFVCVVFCASIQAETALVFGRDERVSSDIGCPCDAVFATLMRDDDSLVTFMSYAYRTREVIGTVSDPLGEVVYDKPNSELFRLTEHADRSFVHAPGIDRSTALYLKNIYDIGNGELLGFVHLETMQAFDANRNPRYPALYTIGLVYSSSYGTSWTFCGDILGVHDRNYDSQAHCGRDPNSGIVGVSCNIGGCPYLIVGEYFYVYFNENSRGINDMSYPSVARAKMHEVIDAARKDTVVPWKKYSRGKWGQDGMSGLGSQIVFPRGDMHTDAAYCRALDKYLLLVNRGRSLDVHVSEDGLNWGEPLIVTEGGPFGRPVSYPWFVSSSKGASSDCHVIGDAFYVYYEPYNVHLGEKPMSLRRVRGEVKESASVERASSSAQ